MMCLITEHVKAKKRINELEIELADAKQIIRLFREQLARQLARLKPCGTIDIHEMSSILLDKLEEMNDKKAELYLADVNCKVYKKDDVKDFLGLDETDEIVYIKEDMDCDDFSAELYGKGVPLLWTNKHALNWFVSEENELWFIEPQNDKLSQTLAGWQGWDVRFFLNR